MTNNKAIELLDNLLGMIEDNHGSDYDKAIHMAIDALKAADVVKVVRCKDCKFIYLDNHIWKCPWTIPSGFDGYCSYGKAKE